MGPLMTIRDPLPIQNQKICSTKATVVTSSHATEIFARVAPIASGASKCQCGRQTQVIYDNLSELLAKHQASLADVVTERFFFRDVTRDWDDFQQVRNECYRRRGLTGRLLPALSGVSQPPWRLGQDLELLVYAVKPLGGNAHVESLGGLGEHTTAKLVQIGPSRYLHLSSLVGRGVNGNQWGPIQRQSALMWSSLLEILGDKGASPANVLRASLYVGEMERDFDQFHASHGEFLQQQNLAPWPAAAIQGGRLHPPEACCGMDVHALLNPEVAKIEPMHSPGASEASQAASSVCGLKVVLPEHTYMFLSAVAATMGKPMSAQETLVPSVRRMIAEVRALLKAHGADFANLVQVVTRLKPSVSAEQYELLCADSGLTDPPHAVVQTGLSRPERLAELEMTAVVPSK